MTRGAEPRRNTGEGREQIDNDNTERLKTGECMSTGWFRKWNNLLRDITTVLAILLSGLGGMLTVSLPNTRLDTLEGIPSNHPIIFWPFIGVGILFLIFLVVTLLGDVPRSIASNDGYQRDEPVKELTEPSSSL